MAMYTHSVAHQGILLVCLFLFLSGFVRADNPIVQTEYTADPAPVIYNNRLYVFTGHDEDKSTTYDMRNWLLFSTVDMANWQHHGSPANLSTFSWADKNAWAGQVINRNNKFYYYVPIRNKRTSGMAIGVGVSDNIEGPYKDAIGGPLVENAQIDPTVYIDDNNQAYLYWGNPDLQYVLLNQDMISYKGGINKVSLTPAGFGTRNGNVQGRPTTFEEGPWLFKRQNLYYMVYAANCCSEDIRYSTGTSATGPWTYRGVIMPSQGASFTNHPGLIDFGGKSYFFYHNGALPGGSGYTRSVAVEEFTYTSNGSIPQIPMTTAGPKQLKSLNPFVRTEAETMAQSSGIEVEVCSEGGMSVGFIDNGDFIKVKGVDFGSGASNFTARVASGGSGGSIELRSDKKDGTLLGKCTVSATGGWQTWQTIQCPVSGASGVHDIFLVFTGGSGYLFNLNWWQFTQKSK
jgi:arabinoxylan arabinofuranohydrolase